MAPRVAAAWPGQAPAPRQPPRWLTELAESAARMDVAPPLQPPSSGGRRSAVLILFADGPGGPDLLFIQRSQGLRQHPGQPAFPGGAIEDADPGPASRRHCARPRRKPGWIRAASTSWPRLPELFIAHSGFRVVPVLAWWHSPGPVSAVDPREVAAVERIRLAELADPACRVTVRIPAGRVGPGFRVKGPAHLGFHSGPGRSPAGPGGLGSSLEYRGCARAARPTVDRVNCSRALRIARYRKARAR